MNYLPDTSPEDELNDLIDLWHTSDPEIPLTEFLHLKPKEYAAYVQGQVTAAAIMDLYDTRSN